MKLINDAVDKVRRAESKGRPELKRSRYLWLRNEPSLSAESREQLTSLLHPVVEEWRSSGICCSCQAVRDVREP